MMNSVLARRIYLITCTVAMPILAGCSLRAIDAPVADNPANLAISWPALPADSPQPWEQADRSTSTLQPGSVLQAGVERFSGGGSALDFGEATRLASSPAGPDQLSYAIYRLPMGGQQPGTVSLDINLSAASATGPGYFVGISDYSTAAWSWHGPLTDGRVTLALPAGEYLSGLGNLFIVVAAFGGVNLDIVAVGANPDDAADSTAPPAPGMLQALPVTGGLELSWLPVIAGDAAGYRIYHSYSPFEAPEDNGVTALKLLEGTTSAVLPLELRRAYVAVACVDHSGNSSTLSPVASALPLAGAASTVSLQAGTNSGGPGSTIVLTASGAELYDFDTDGDGDFDITGQLSGTVAADTSRTGLIRPRVRGTSGSGTSVALGGVSLLITANQRPYATAFVADGDGYAPFSTQLIGSGQDADGSIAEDAWDFEGDGIYEYSSAVSPETTGSWPLPGLYNARVRVTDDGGAWDTDSVAVLVRTLEAMLTAVPATVEPGDSFLLQLTAAVAPDSVDWDLDGDGLFESIDSGPIHTIPGIDPGPRQYLARANFPGGQIVETSVDVLIHGWVKTPQITGPTGDGVRNSMVLINGNPAVAVHGHYEENLSYCRATAPDGSSWGSLVVVDGLGGLEDIGEHMSMLQIDGRPAIAYEDPTAGVLLYVIANDPDGADWGLPQILDSGSVGAYPSMAIADGNPAIAYQDVGNGNLKYIRASNIAGTDWEPPITIDPDPAFVGDYVWLADISGAPAAAYANMSTGALKYVRALDAQGTLWGGPITISNRSVSSDRVALAEVNGRPAIAFQDPIGTDVRYIRANDAAGASWPHTMVVDSADLCGYNLAMKVIGGVPMITYGVTTTNMQMLAIANDGEGTAWRTEQVGYAASVYHSGSSSIIDPGGRPAVCYYLASTSLHFAQRL